MTLAEAYWTGMIVGGCVMATLGWLGWWLGQRPWRQPQRRGL
jgi:hypothetical protein